MFKNRNFYYGINKNTYVLSVDLYFRLIIHLYYRIINNTNLSEKESLKLTIRCFFLFCLFHLLAGSYYRVPSNSFPSNYFQSNNFQSNNFQSNNFQSKNLFFRVTNYISE